MKHPASTATVKFSTNDFKITAIVDKLPKEIRGGIVKIAGFANGIIHRVATLNKEFTLPEPDQPRSATIYLSTRNLDSDMDIVMPTGWDKSMYRGQGLWAHQHSSDPIYKALDTQSDDYGLWQVIQFAETERGENYWSMVKGGFLQTFSAGMWVKPEGSVMKGEARFKSIMDLCKDWPEFTKAQQDQVARFIVNKYLIESTLCNVPANPFAMVMAVNKGELSLSDGVKKELNFEGLVKKCQDSGQLESKTIDTPAPVEDEKEEEEADKCEDCPHKKMAMERKREEEGKSHPSVRIVPTVKVVSGVPLEQIVEKYVEKKIARLRGKI